MVEIAPMADYLARSGDDPLAAARLFCWDKWRSGCHPLACERAARDAFALTEDEIVRLRNDWGERQPATLERSSRQRPNDAPTPGVSPPSEQEAAS